MKPALNPDKCQTYVPDMSTRFHLRDCQCSKPVFKNGLCRIHQPEAVSARKAATEARRTARWNNSPAQQWLVERRVNRELKAEIQQLKAEIQRLNDIMDSAIV